MRKASMLTVKAKIPAHADYEPILPLAVPDLKEVKAFVNHLHSLGKYWQGEIFGWQAEYTPESKKKPEDSKMTFTPADFWIGESGIWFFSLVWEHGKDKDPVEFLGHRSPKNGPKNQTAKSADETACSALKGVGDLGGRRII